jgi:hypothetical protein
VSHHEHVDEGPERVQLSGPHVHLFVPASELLATSGLCDVGRFEGEVVDVCQNPRGRERVFLREQLPEVDPVVVLQIRYEILAVLI